MRVPTTNADDLPPVLEKKNETILVPEEEQLEDPVTLKTKNISLIIVDCLVGLSLLISVFCTSRHTPFVHNFILVCVILSIIFIMKGVCGICRILGICNIKHRIQQCYSHCRCRRADKDVAGASMKERQFMYVVYLALVLLLSLVSVISFCVDTNFWFWGFSEIASYSYIGNLAVTSILLARIVRPAPGNTYSIAIIGLGAGVYFAILSWFSIYEYLVWRMPNFFTSPSIPYSDNPQQYTHNVDNMEYLRKRLDKEDVYNLVHLMPIPVIASLLLPFGASVLLSNLRLESSKARELCPRSVPRIVYVLAALTGYAAFILTTIRGEVQGITAILLAMNANFLLLLGGKGRIPSLLGWVLSLILAALAVFSAVISYNTQISQNYGVWSEVSLPALVMNIVVDALCLVAGLYGIFKYSRSVHYIMGSPFSALQLWIGEKVKMTQPFRRMEEKEDYTVRGVQAC